MQSGWQVIWEFFFGHNAGATNNALGILASIITILLFVWGLIAGAARLFPRTPKPIPVIVHAEAAASDPPQNPAPTSPCYIGVPTGRRVVGREVDLVELYGKLAESGGVQVTNSGAILAGQGGIGKSTLARAYAEEYRDDYAGVLWLTAGTRQAVIDGLMGLCGPLGLAVPEAAKEADAQAVLAKLAARGDRWLVIYDNVEGYDDFKGLEPRGAHLIVTTRQGTGWPGFAVMKADVLKFDTEDGAAVRLLMETAERTEDAAGARALAEVLGGLPLALVMAGRLIAREGGGFDDYRRDVSAIIAREPRNEDYPTSVIGAVRLSYARLSENARLVADLFAWWAAEGLAARLIADAPGGEWWEAHKADMPAAVQALAGDAAAVRAAMAELADRSLIAGPSVDAAMHRMTAAALRAMQGDDAMARAAAALLGAVYPGEVHVSSNWTECRRLTPHVRAMWESGAAPATAAMDTLLNHAAIYLGRLADFPGALEMARGALALKQVRLPEEDRGIALGHGTLGMALSYTDDLPGALLELDRAVALDEAHRPGSAHLASSYDQQGGVLFELGRQGDDGALEQAAKRFQQALALRRGLFGRGSDEVAESANNLGAVRSAQGRGAAAARLFGASLAIRRAVLPPGDARLGYGLVNTGSSWLEAGRADRAEALLQEARDLLWAVHEGNAAHPEVRSAAGWLVDCLLVRARAEDNRGAREARAKRICAEVGLDFDARAAIAARYPYTPGGTP